MQLNTAAKLMLFAGLLGCGQTALLICLPALSANTGLNTAQLGAVVALGSSIFLIGNPLWGYISDRWSRKGTLVVGLLGYASCFLIMAFAVSELSGLDSGRIFLTLLSARTIYGLTASAIYPTIQAWTLDDINQDETLGTDGEARALTRLAAAVNVGRLLGPVVAAPALIIGPSFVLLIFALMAALLTLLAIFISATQSDNRHTPDTPKPKMKNVRLMAAAAMVTTILGAIQYSLGFLLMKHFNSATQAGLATALILVSTTLVVIALQIRVLSRLAQLWPTAVPIACFCLVAGCLLLFQGSLLSFFTAIVLISCAAATLASAYQSEATKSSSSRGRTVGMYGMAHAIGSSFGVWLSGWLLVKTDSALFIAITGISIIASLALSPNYVFVRRRQAISN